MRYSTVLIAELHLNLSLKLLAVFRHLYEIKAYNTMWNNSHLFVDVLRVVVSTGEFTVSESALCGFDKSFELASLQMNMSLTFPFVHNKIKLYWCSYAAILWKSYTIFASLSFPISGLLLGWTMARTFALQFSVSLKHKWDFNLH